MKRLARLVVIAAVLAPALIALPDQAGASGCPANWVIGVHGAGSPELTPDPGADQMTDDDQIPLMGETVGVWVALAVQDLPSDTEYHALYYNSVASTDLPGYGDAIQSGRTNLLTQVNLRLAVCPQTRIGLVGYSEGAQVVNSALRAMSPGVLDHVRGVIVFGDPTSEPDQASHVEATVDGEPAQDDTSHGIFGRHALPDAVQSRALEYCIVDDPVCDSPFFAQSVLLDRSNHLLYRNESHRWRATALAGFMSDPWTPPAEPPPPPPDLPSPLGSTMYWIDTFADAPVYDSPTSTNETGTLNASSMNFTYCKLLGRDVTDDAGAHNHWWLRVEPDQGPSQQYVSAYYLRNWGDDEARDNSGDEIPTCAVGGPGSPPVTPPPAPAPPGATMWWIDTFADAAVYDSPTSTTQTGTLHASAMNWAYCKALGRDIRDDSGAHNHWWLQVDPDVGPGQQYVSAYYLRNWGDDQAKDNDGNDIPDCAPGTGSPPAPPPPPPPSDPPPTVPLGSTMWWIDTFADAPAFASATSTTQTGTMHASAMNWAYCKVLGRDIGDDAGSTNHWWLLVDPDVGPGQQWVSAYYLRKWGNNEARDNDGNEIPDCPGSSPAPPSSPPPAPPPPPPPPPPQYSQWWVDTFTDATVYDSPWTWNPTGTLYGGTNYVYCKALGPDFGGGGSHNHWWLLTDPDEGPNGQWVPAYYLSWWGNDEAYDNYGNDIPIC